MGISLPKAYELVKTPGFPTIRIGADEPTGILHNTDGAKTALTAETLTYDDVISLYFSVDKEYRRNGIWLMNDKTALVLRKLKDNNGNYLWNQANDTILGK
nr:MAG TPA: major capsid protein [Caudoviricetes sp.]